VLCGLGLKCFSTLGSLNNKEKVLEALAIVHVEDDTISCK
jgi:hypothetical protein